MEGVLLAHSVFLWVFLWIYHSNLAWTFYRVLYIHILYILRIKNEGNLHSLFPCWGHEWLMSLGDWKIVQALFLTQIILNSPEISHVLQSSTSKWYTETFKMVFKFENTFFGYKNYTVIFYNLSILCLPNFRTLRYIAIEKFPKHRCIIGWWDTFQLNLQNTYFWLRYPVLAIYSILTKF